MKWTILLFCLLLGSGSSPVQASANPLVFVSILPQRSFVERISGGLVDVSVMVMPGASPATYEPTPKQMTELAQAKAYFSIGVPFENTWLPRIAEINPAMEVIPTDRGISKRSMAAHEHRAGHIPVDGPGEYDGTQGGREQQDQNGTEGIPDPHIWLAPDLVKKQAWNMYDGLIQMDPSNKTAYAANLDSFLKDIDRLDDEIRSIFASLPEGQRSFMVFHPAWGYFAEQYELHQVSIESEGKEPSPRQLAEIVRLGRELGVTVVFVQPQFSNRSARVIAKEMGARVIALDPLAYDWADNLIRAARAFEQALE